MKINIIKGITLLGIAAISFAFALNSSQSSESELSGVNSTNSEETVGIQFFSGTWEEALAKAKGENKLIFLDAYASWCGPCKRMAKREFSRVEVGDFFNENYINFKMDMEKGIGPQMAAKLGLKAYPTLYIMDGEGEPLVKAVGYHDAESLLELGKTMAK